jgi:putative ABC transport system permease protein
MEALWPNLYVTENNITQCVHEIRQALGANLAQTLAGVDAAWREFVPDRPINRQFLDDRIAGLYLDITREIELFAAFAGFALMIRQFVRPVLLANALAWPLAWWIMRSWLDGFAYRIDLGPEPFLTAGVTAIAIAVLTTAFHAIQVARARPVTTLRYE